MKQQHVLPGPVYDALQMSCLATGGIGAGFFYCARGEPHCYMGHLAFVGAPPDDVPTFAAGKLRNLPTRLSAYGITAAASDLAVFLANRDRNITATAKVPFEQWCKQLNVVRDERKSHGS